MNWKIDFHEIRLKIDFHEIRLKLFLTVEKYFDIHIKNISGWSSSNPFETVMHYGIPCCDLSVGDVCLPPSHPEAASSEEIFKSFEELV